MNTGLSPRGRGKRIRCRSTAKKARSIPAWAGETSQHIPVRPFGEVYPRVGGGNIQLQGQGLAAVGLSPRGRGKRPAFASRVSPRRSIPAWAGETVLPLTTRSRLKVYPRVGGGNAGGIVLHQKLVGLSPRGRGKLLGHLRIVARIGSIPAWAGETGDRRFHRPVNPVYPRVGGGNGGGAGDVKGSPGLSPRGRGKPTLCHPPPGRGGSIPAWAGETEKSPGAG